MTGLPLTIELTPAQLEAIAERVDALLADRQAPADDRYLNAEQAAAYLACSTGRIYDLIQLQKLTPLRDGRRVLFRRVDLDACLSSE
jgi:excisionase family DNA binding protein